MNKLSLGIHKQKAKLLSKMGKLEISHDDFYDQLHQHYHTNKKSTQDTIKQFKNVSEHLHALSSSISQLVQSIGHTYPDSDPIHLYIEKMARSLEQFDENHVQLFQKEIQFSCVDPITNYLVEMDTPKQVMHQRDKAKIEYDERRTQLNKLMESKKPHSAQKVPHTKEKLQHAEMVYNGLRQQAKQQLASLINSHGSHMDPVVVSLQTSLSKLARGMERTVGHFDDIASDISGSHFERSKIEVPPEDTETASNTYSDTSSSTAVSSSTSASAPLAPPRDRSGSTGAHHQHYLNQSASAQQASSNAVPEEFNSEWYYLNDDLEQQGPFEFKDMKRMYQSLQIKDTTHVFGGDMSDWMELGQVPKLKNALT